MNPWINIALYVRMTSAIVLPFTQEILSVEKLKAIKNELYNISSYFSK